MYTFTDSSRILSQLLITSSVQVQSLFCHISDIIKFISRKQNKTRNVGQSPTWWPLCQI